jgi:hypothetical protein
VFPKRSWSWTRRSSTSATDRSRAPIPTPGSTPPTSRPAVLRVAGPVPEHLAEGSEDREEQLLDGEGWSGETELVLVLTGDHRDLRQVWGAPLVGLAVYREAPERLEEGLGVQGRACLPVEARFARLFTSHLVGCAGWVDDDLTRSENPFHAVDQDVDRAGEDLEALLLVRVVLLGRARCARSLVNRLDFEQLAPGIAGCFCGRSDAGR